MNYADMRASEIRSQVLAALLLVAAVLGSLAWANGVHIPATWHLTINADPAVPGARYRVLELTEITVRFNKPVEQSAVENQILDILSGSWHGASTPPAQLAAFKWDDDLTVHASVRVGPTEAVISFAGVRDSTGVRVGAGPRVTIFRPDPAYVFRSFLGSAAQVARGLVASGTGLCEEAVAGPTPFCPETCLAWPSPDGRFFVIREYVALEDDCAGPPTITLWVCDIETGGFERVGDWPFPQCTPVWSHDSRSFFIGPGLFTADGERLARWNGQGHALAAAVASDERHVAILTTVWGTGHAARLDLIVWDSLTGTEKVIRNAVKPTLCDGLVTAPSYFAWTANGSAVVHRDAAMTLETTIQVETSQVETSPITELALHGHGPAADTLAVVSPDGMKVAKLTRLENGWNCAVSTTGGGELGQFTAASAQLVWAGDSTKLLFVDKPAAYDLGGRCIWAGRRDPSAPPILRVIGWGPGSDSILFMAEPVSPAG